MNCRAGYAVTGLLPSARERLTERGRNEATDVRSLYYPELFHRLTAKQVALDIAYATIARFGAEAVKNTLTDVNNSTQPALPSLHCQRRETARPRVSAIHMLSVE